MRLAVLSSGSKGNALLVEHGRTAVLIDCGLSPKRLRHRLKQVDRQLVDLDAIVLTHGHGDHAGGASRVAGPFKLRVYATRGTHEDRARSGGLTNFVPVETGTPFDVGDLRFESFSVPHDARGAVGYVVEGGGARLGICTDIGRPTGAVADALSDVDTLYLEYNYDEGMLKEGPYPPFLKRRVGGPLGHLSNVQAAQLTERAYSPRLRRLVLAHLSETNNTPALAIKAARAAIPGSGVQIIVAPQHHAHEWLEIDAGSTVDSGDVAKKTRPAKPRETVTTSKVVSVAVTRQLELFSGRRR